MESIAITGMSCMFPGAPSLDAFWKLLSEGREAIGEVPAERWNINTFFDVDPKAQGKTNSRFGGFIEGVDRFDAAFFGITPREAAQMDPQQRILLELAYEALEDAGIAPATLAGSNTAVFVGAMTNDYFRQQISDEYRRIDVHTASGAGLSMLANRLSYQFDLRGPSVTVDTACSSSLVAVLQACQSIWTGQSRLALAAGVNVILDPAINVFYAKAGLSAPDGRCKTFSAAADGIGRAEGAGVIVLKPLKHALADKDQIYAVIRGGAVNHDGRSNGLTQPNRWAQEQLLRSAFTNASIDSLDLQYIELHGTGTLIGDPIEANALAAVLMEGGERAPCLVGSVKTNFGHLEAAAGIAGLIKLALSISHSQVPPSLLFDAPNPHIPFDRIPIRVNTQLSPWPTSNERRLGGVSSFGIGGANAHVVLQSAPASQPKTKAKKKQDNQPHWLLLSARSEAALKAMAGRYAEFLQNASASNLPAICATALRRKGIHDFRLGVVGHDPRSLAVALQSFAAGNEHPDVLVGRYRSSQKRLTLVVPELDRIDWRLLSCVAASANAKKAWAACRIALQKHNVALPSAETLSADTSIDKTHQDFNTWHFAVQYALSKQMFDGACSIDAIFADGVGQLAVLAAIDAIPLNTAPEWLKISGSANGDQTEPLYSIHCDFSSGVDPSLSDLDLVEVKQTWLNRFEASLDHTASDIVVLGSTEHPLPHTGSGERFAPAYASETWHRTLARLALRHQLKWSNWAENEPFIRLPAYPWQRESHWLAPVLNAETGNPGATTTLQTRILPDNTSASSSLLGTRIDQPTEAWRTELRADRITYIPDHRVQEAVVLPGSGYVEIGLAVHAKIEGTMPAAIADLRFHQAMILEDGQTSSIHVGYDKQLQEFTVHSQSPGSVDWILNARGRLAKSSAPSRTMDLSELKKHCTRFTDGESHYANMRLRGFGYGPAFQGVRELWLDASGEHVLAKIARPISLDRDTSNEHLHPALFDAALQSTLTTLTARGDFDLYIPTGIDHLQLYQSTCDDFWCYGGLQSASHGIVIGDIVLFNDSGELIAEASGVRAQALTRKERSDLKEIDTWLYQWSWKEKSLETTGSGGRWMVLANDSIDAELLAQKLAEVGTDHAVLVLLGDQFEQISDTRFSVRRDNRADLDRVFESTSEMDIAGVVHAWALGRSVTADVLPYSGAEADSVLQILRILGTAQRQRPAQLVLLTRGVQSVQDAGDVASTVDGLMQAPLLGLARVAVNEYPSLVVRAIDIDHEPTALSQLALEIVSVDKEEEVALRAGNRYVHRMSRTKGAELKSSPQAVAESTFLADTAYLITGGFGGFGLEVAAWLVRRGARHIALAGRRGASTPEAIDAIARLREAGANIIEISADISQEAGVVRLLERIRAELPPLDGIFHAAAALDDAPIAQLESRQIDNAMGAKALGAWYLHRHTSTDSLRHFVLFSSIASMVGGTGQASYAMSCGYLDALARYRRAQGLAAVSLNWGALRDVGMATRFGDVEKYLSGTGVGLFTPEQAVNLLELAVAWQPTELAIAKMDWKQWAAVYPAWGVSPKYRDLLADVNSKPTGTRHNQLRADLLAMEPDQREASIVEVLIALLAQTIGTGIDAIDSGVPLPSLGLDSLMAMDLLVAIEDSLAVKVPMLLVMKGNSIVQLAQQIDTLMTDPSLSGDVESTSEPRSRELPDELDLEAAERFIANLGDFDDNEVEQLLQQIMHEKEEVQ